jgi:Ca-activated chloride channel homolog
MSQKPTDQDTLTPADEQLDSQLQQLLQGPVPAPNASAKARALSAAMSAFAAVQEAQPLPVEAIAQQPLNIAAKKNSGFFQGFFNRFRPTHDINLSRNNAMNFSQKQLLITGMTSCSLAVLGALLINNYLLLDQSSPEQRLELAVKQQPAMSITADADAVEEVVVMGARESLDRTLTAAKTAEVMMQAKVKRAAPQLAMTLQDTPAPAPTAEFRDRFKEFSENSVTAVSETPISTFSIDVDTSAYSFVRKMLNSGQLPAKDAVRSEEMINYFDYQYPVPKSGTNPFTPSITLLDSPWTKGNKLIHIGIKGYQIPAAEIPQSNLVFLLDVSGSMSSPDKLPLVQQSMELLLANLKPEDKVAIVVYAGAAGTVLAPTAVKDKQKILAAINTLTAGGSTAGAEGIALAYQLAEANFNPKAVNRIILATDGDFNLGETADTNLQDFVERKRAKGIYLSVLGFGQGNYQDQLMQTLAQNGNGTAAYIDTLSEAQKVLVHEATSTLFPIAEDVKIQVEFNPATVSEYRLLGYETRALQREDFNNDKVDAGEIGSGHSVTAIYEITPSDSQHKLLDPSRYQVKGLSKADKSINEYGFLRIRYKLPGEKKSQLIETPIAIQQDSNSMQLQEARFASAVAGFAQLLRGSPYSGNLTYDKVIDLAQANKGEDKYGYRTEFVQLVRKAKIAKGQ